MSEIGTRRTRMIKSHSSGSPWNVCLMKFTLPDPTCGFRIVMLTGVFRFEKKNVTLSRWSYGVLLWEIVTYGGSPYPGIKNVEIFEFLKKGYRMSQPEGCPSELYALMRRTWEKESEDRPDFATIRHLLDDMMERSQGGDYFQLHVSREVTPVEAEGQRSPDGTLEADVTYSSLQLPDCPLAEEMASEAARRADSPESASSPPPLTYSENVLYSSVDSNIPPKEPIGQAPTQSRRSSSSTSLYELHIPYDSNSDEPLYENELCLLTINEKGIASAPAHEAPFEFKMVGSETEAHLVHDDGEGVGAEVQVPPPALHFVSNGKGKRKVGGGRKPNFPTAVFV